MRTPLEYRDRANDSLLTVLGDIPELIRNLVVAEVDAAKGWARRTGKDAGIGAALVLGALFFLFWCIPLLGAFLIAGLSSWWPVWLSALVVLVFIFLVALVLALLGVLKFRKITRPHNPVKAVVDDLKEVRDEL